MFSITILMLLIALVGMAYYLLVNNPWFHATVMLTDGILQFSMVITALTLYAKRKSPRKRSDNSSTSDTTPKSAGHIEHKQVTGDENLSDMKHVDDVKL